MHVPAIYVGNAGKVPADFVGSRIGKDANFSKLLGNQLDGPGSCTWHSDKPLFAFLA
jgi:hypothetical protein